MENSIKQSDQKDRDLLFKMQK